jgi:hypothetical protein
MDEVEAFRRSTARKRNLRLGLLGLVIASPFLYLGFRCQQEHAKIEEHREEYRKSLALSEPELAALKQGIDEERRRVTAARAAWPRAVAPEALAALEQSEQPCPVRFQAPTPTAAESYVRYASIDGNYFGSGAFRTFKTGEPVSDATLAASAAILEEIGAHLAADKADRRDLDRLRNLPDTATFVIVDERKEPVVTTSLGEVASFAAGVIGGRAFVYDVTQQAIICTCDIDVSNSLELKFDFSYMEDNPLDRDARMLEAAKAVLQRDLEMKVRQALARELRATRRAAAATPTSPTPP